MRLGPTIIGAILIIISVIVFYDGANKLSTINACLNCSKDAPVIEQLYGALFGSIGAVIFVIGMIGGRKNRSAL